MGETDKRLEKPEQVGLKESATVEIFYFPHKKEKKVELT